MNPLLKRHHQTVDADNATSIAAFLCCVNTPEEATSFITVMWQEQFSSAYHIHSPLPHFLLHQLIFNQLRFVDVTVVTLYPVYANTLQSKNLTSCSQLFVACRFELLNPLMLNSFSLTRHNILRKILNLICESNINSDISTILYSCKPYNHLEAVSETKPGNKFVIAYKSNIVPFSIKFFQNWKLCQVNVNFYEYECNY